MKEPYQRAARQLLQDVSRFFPAVTAADVMRSFRHMFRLQATIAGRCCGDAGDRLAQYCAWIQHLRDYPTPARPRGIEIGTLYGGGCLMMLNALRDENRPGTMTCIDPLTGYYDQSEDKSGTPISPETLLGNLALEGFDSARLDLRRHSSQSAEARAGLEAKSAAVILIDGDHSAGGVRHDWETYRQYAAEGAFVLFDDYSDPGWPAVTETVDAIIADPPRGWLPVGQLGTTFIFRRAAKARGRHKRTVHPEAITALAALLEAFLSAEQARALTIAAARRDRELGRLREQTAARDRDLAVLKEQVAGRDKELALLRDQDAGKDKALALLHDQAVGRDKELTQLKEQAAGQNKELAQLKTQLAERDRDFTQLKAQLDVRNRDTAQFREQLLGRDGSLTQLKAQLDVRERDTVQLRDQLMNRDKGLAQLKAQVAAREGDLARLRAQLAGSDRDRACLTAQAADHDRASTTCGAYISRLRADLDGLTSAYLVLRWSQLAAAEGLKSVFLFGAGKHTDWFLGVVRGHPGPDILGILDDKAVPGDTRAGYPVLRPEDALATACDAIVLSTDTLQGALRHRCREVFRGAIRTVDLYAGLPPDRLTFEKTAPVSPARRVQPLRVSPVAAEPGGGEALHPTSRAA